MSFLTLREFLAPFLHREMTTNLDLADRFFLLGMRLHPASRGIILPPYPMRPLFIFPLHCEMSLSKVHPYGCISAAVPAAREASVADWQKAFEKKLTLEFGEELLRSGFSLPAIASILEGQLGEEFVQTVREAVSRDFPFFNRPTLAGDRKRIVTDVETQNLTLWSDAAICARKVGDHYERSPTISPKPKAVWGGRLTDRRRCAQRSARRQRQRDNRSRICELGWEALHCRRRKGAILLIALFKRSIDLAKIGESMPGIAPIHGRFLGEAAAVCLEAKNHAPDVVVLRAGDGIFNQEYGLVWERCTDQQRRCYRDSRNAKEWGACGIAIEITRDMTGLVVVERSWQTTGFDYWLGQSSDPVLTYTARLEVSGILDGQEREIRTRIEGKLGQMEQSDDLGLPGYVAVVEFSQPEVRFVAKP